MSDVGSVPNSGFGPPPVSLYTNFISCHLTKDVHLYFYLQRCVNGFLHYLKMAYYLLLHFFILLFLFFKLYAL